MSNIPTYYNNFKKDGEGQPIEMFDIKKWFLGALAALSLTRGTGAEKPNIEYTPYLQKVRETIFYSETLTGEDLENAQKYVLSLEEALESVEKRQQEEAEKDIIVAKKAADEAEARAKAARNKVEEATTTIRQRNDVVSFLSSVFIAVVRNARE